MPSHLWQWLSIRGRYLSPLTWPLPAPEICYSFDIQLPPPTTTFLKLPSSLQLRPLALSWGLITRSQRGITYRDNVDTVSTIWHRTRAFIRSPSNITQICKLPPLPLPQPAIKCFGDKLLIRGEKKNIAAIVSIIAGHHERKTTTGASTHLWAPLLSCSYKDSWG